MLIISLIRGIGYGVHLIFLFSWLKSYINLTRPSFFRIMKLGASYSMWLNFVITPMVKSLSKYLLKDLLWIIRVRKASVWYGLASSLKIMSAGGTVQSPRLPPKRSSIYFRYPSKITRWNLVRRVSLLTSYSKSSF